MKQKVLPFMGIIALAISALSLPSCTQDDEIGEEYSLREYPTLANKVITRFGEGGGEVHPPTPTIWTGQSVLAGKDTIATGNDIYTFQIVLSWNEGIVGDNVYFHADNVTAITPTNASIDNSNGDFRWNSAMNKISGRVRISGHIPTIWGHMANYTYEQLIDEDVDFVIDSIGTNY